MSILAKELQSQVNEPVDLLENAQGEVDNVVKMAEELKDKDKFETALKAAESLAGCTQA